MANPFVTYEDRLLSKPAFVMLYKCPGKKVTRVRITRELEKLTRTLTDHKNPAWIRQEMPIGYYLFAYDRCLFKNLLVLSARPPSLQ